MGQESSILNRSSSRLGQASSRLGRTFSMFNRNSRNSGKTSNVELQRTPHNYGIDFTMNRRTYRIFGIFDPHQIKSIKYQTGWGKELEWQFDPDSDSGLLLSIDNTFVFAQKFVILTITGHTESGDDHTWIYIYMVYDRHYKDTVYYPVTYSGYDVVVEREERLQAHIYLNTFNYAGVIIKPFRYNFGYQHPLPISIAPEDRCRFKNGMKLQTLDFDVDEVEEMTYAQIATYSANQLRKLPDVLNTLLLDPVHGERTYQKLLHHWSIAPDNYGNILYRGLTSGLYAVFEHLWPHVLEIDRMHVSNIENYCVQSGCVDPIIWLLEYNLIRPGGSGRELRPLEIIQNDHSALFRLYLDVFYSRDGYMNIHLTQIVQNHGSHMMDMLQMTRQK